GTLTPIVARPEDALLAPEMRAVVRGTAAAFPLVAIVSGRDRSEVERLVGLPELGYVGSHGFDIAGPPGSRLRHEVGHDLLPALDDAERTLDRTVGAIPGLRLDRKRFSLAVHVRQVAPEDRPRVAAAVDAVVAAAGGLRREDGKAVHEIRPDVEWDKGRAVLWLLERLGLGGALAI